MKKFFYILCLEFFLISCGSDNEENAAAPGNSPFLSGLPEITATLYARGFNSPVGIINAGDGTKRLFIVEQRGIIKIIANNAVLAEPLLDITSLVRSGGEQGLLGLAFPPDFATKNYFYINYTNRAGVGNTVVARYLIDSETGVAENSSGRTLLTITQPFSNHNGGHMAFGSDNYLYISTGDGGSAGDPQGNAQDTSSLLGKILRINVEGNTTAYTVPADNPFDNEVWGYGLRNPWRFSFDRLTNDMFIADVGQDETEEINFLTAGANGINFGWNIMEGSECYQNENCNRSNLTLPISGYPLANGDCSVIGGYIYRGTEFPALYGTYLYGDYCSGKIRALKRNVDTWQGQVILDTNYRISSFGEDEDGNIYFSDLNSGNIYKITAK